MQTYKPIEYLSAPCKFLLCVLCVLICPSFLPAQAPLNLRGKTATLTLLDAVSSNTANDSSIEARLDSPLEVSGEIILPDGTLFEGNVRTKPARRMLRSGSLRMIFHTVRLPDGRTSPIDLSLLEVQPAQNGRHRAHVQLDSEGAVHPHLSKKRLLLNVGVALAIGKIADDASETIIRSLSLAGARYVAWGSGAVFLMIRKGESVKLLQGTKIQIAFQRDPQFREPLGVLPLGAAPALSFSDSAGFPLH